MDHNVVRGWLRSVLGPYALSDRVYTHVDAVLLAFSSLRPKTEVYTYDDGRSALLLQVGGTIPIEYRGATYHIPIVVWLPHGYPREVPIAYVEPARGMAVRKGHKHVQLDGRIVVPDARTAGEEAHRDSYLRRWERKWEACSLLELVRYLQGVFGAEPPVYAVIANGGGSSSVGDRREAAAGPSSDPRRSSSSNSYDARPPPALPGQTDPQIASPAPGQAPLRPPKPGQPADPPAAYAQPTQPPRQASAGYHAGPPQPEYQQHYYQQPNRTAFGSAWQPPAPGPHPHPQQQQRAYSPHHHSPQSPPAQHAAFGGPGRSQSLPPEAPPMSPMHRFQSPTQGHAFPPPSGFSSPQQAQPPWAAGGQQGAPPPPPAAPTKPPAPRDLLSEEEEDAALSPVTTPSGPPPVLPPNPALVSLHHALHQKLYQRLGALSSGLSAEAQQMQLLSADLDRGHAAILDEMARLEAVRNVCRVRAERVGQVVEGARERVQTLREKVEKELEAPGTGDDWVCATSIVGNQLIDLVAEDNAIEDTLYHLGKALNAESITLERFLKQARFLAREQFMRRALAMKICTSVGWS